jgi:molybdenum cofactor cytidylyltransferase
MSKRDLEERVKESMPLVKTSKYGIVILAAGASTRMGCPKQLLDYRGIPLLRHAAEAALASCCERVIVVLGCRAAQLREVLTGLPVTIIENPAWEGGMGTSIRAGVTVVQNEGLEGVILGLADQPLIDAGIFDTLIHTHHESGQPIVTSEYAGTVGVPVFFAREYFPDLLSLEPSQGCKGVILKNTARAVRLTCPDAEMDVDTPEDYNRVRSSTLALG